MGVGAAGVSFCLAGSCLVIEAATSTFVLSDRAGDAPVSWKTCCFKIERRFAAPPSDAFGALVLNPINPVKASMEVVASCVGVSRESACCEVSNLKRPSITIQADL